ncbi:MAG: hypothetical protein N2378_16615, partial [Chloroflexaceae bacterium]|nr:hypothetical protein [Chloroflexaceae bacterium]
MQATDLDQVLINFNRQARLTAEQLQHWFVERQSSPRSALHRWLRAQPEVQKIIFIGHRGSGKTTELTKLADELQDRFITIGFDVLELTGRTELGHEDLMLVLFTRVIRECINQTLISRPLFDSMREPWQRLRDWWDRFVAGMRITPPPEELSFGARLNFEILELETEVRQSADAREALRREVGFRMTELLRHLNWATEQAERVAGHRLPVIIEGLDKIDLEAARRIFLDHFATLNAPKSNVIFTCPSALLYSEDFEQIRQQFSRIEILPNIPPKQRSGQADREGLRTLREIVLRRMAPHLIEEAALNRLVSASGGVPTILMRLVQNAATYAEGATITRQDVDRAILTERAFLTPSLTEADWEILRQRRGDHWLTADREIKTLLYKGALVEYRNSQNGEPCLLYT